MVWILFVVWLSLSLFNLFIDLRLLLLFGVIICWVVEVVVFGCDEVIGGLRDKFEKLFFIVDIIRLDFGDFFLRSKVLIYLLGVFFMF